MIKEQLKEKVELALKAAVDEGALGSVNPEEVEVVIENPRHEQHGDFACGVAMRLAKQAKKPPFVIAEAIVEHLDVSEEYVKSVEIAKPGFINFRLGLGWLKDVLHEINLKQGDYGRCDLGAGKRVMVEYVSANPTGDLHIGHGRGAVYGSCLASLLRFAGYDVAEEFYINDAGEQMSQLGRCAWAIYQSRNGKNAAYPDEGYPREYLEHFVEQINGDYMELSEEEGVKTLGKLTEKVIIKSQRELLEKLRVSFDCWFSETRLHDTGQVEQALQKLRERKMSYEQDGAVWFRAKELGDERDRVLVKQGGQTTYLANDAAYHLDKYERGFEWLINVWGADHHGQVPGLKAIVQALGKERDSLEVVLTQIVNLSREGKMVRMSKRMGTVVTLAEVMDEVGVDATRYYLAESNPTNPINFDLELAKKSSRENPAFYIQYAHARCCAILRKALEPVVDVESGKTLGPPVSEAQWQEFQESYKQSSRAFNEAFDQDEQVLKHQKDLIMRLESFPDEIVECVKNRAPGRIARYVYELANDLQKFYEQCRVITDNVEVTRARLGIIVAVKQVINTGLGLIGVSAPERM